MPEEINKDTWMIIFIVGLMALSVIAGEIYFWINRFKNNRKKERRVR